jgi:hypothetical protein
MGAHGKVLVLLPGTLDALDNIKARLINRGLMPASLVAGITARPLGMRMIDVYDRAP